MPGEQVLAGQDGGGPVVMSPGGLRGHFHQIFLNVKMC